MQAPPIVVCNTAPGMRKSIRLTRLPGLSWWRSVLAFRGPFSEVVELANRGDTDGLLRRLDSVTDHEGQVSERAAIAYAIGRIGARCAVGTLVRLASDERIDVRLAAVDALGRLGGATATQALLMRLADLHAGVRLATLKALRGKFTNDEVGTLAGLLLSDESGPVRVEAAIELGHLRVAPSLVALRKAFRTRDVMTALAAGVSLRKMRELSGSDAALREIALSRHGWRKLLAACLLAGRRRSK